jgi:hypothetical protein
VTHLERCQDVAVRQPQERVRVRVAVDVTELTGDARLRRGRQVEDEALARPEAVGEQPPIWRHFMFGVMRPVAAPGNRQRRHQTPVAFTVLGDIEHGEEVGLCRVVGSGPQIQIVRCGADRS